MAVKSIFLGAREALRIGTDVTIPLAIPTQALILGQETGLPFSCAVPDGFDSISSVTLRYRRTGTGIFILSLHLLTHPRLQALPHRGR